MDTVSVPKKEYLRLKKLEAKQEAEEQLDEVVADLQAGRIKRVR
jgi:hypothetical protein